MIKAKKNLGQHFLNNKNILGALIDAGNISAKDIVLEIGPGMGALTELIAERAKKVIAIEKDRDLIAGLEQKFKKNKNVKIVEGDILHFNFKKLKLTSKYKIVANIPYYITGKFLRLFLEANQNGITRPSMMMLMVQREVAERIVAKDGKESLLSLSVKAFGKPSIMRIVPRGAFVPPPNVDSAILKIDSINNHWFIKNNIKPGIFFETARRAFQQKRKTLKNSIKITGKYEKLRPETLGLVEWGDMLGGNLL